MNPKIIFCDEPVSALDVSIQAQTLSLLQDLQADFNLSYVFVAHDLSVVQHLRPRGGDVRGQGRGNSGVFGRAVQQSPASLHRGADVFRAEAESKYQSDRLIMQGRDVANPSIRRRCWHHPRCRYAVDKCRTETPGSKELKPEHFVACHRAEEAQIEGV